VALAHSSLHKNKKFSKANEIFFKHPKRKSALKGVVLDLSGAIKSFINCFIIL
jgi:hypothetical protein